MLDSLRLLLFCNSTNNFARFMGEPHSRIRKRRFSFSKQSRDLKRRLRINLRPTFNFRPLPKVCFFHSLYSLNNHFYNNGIHTDGNSRFRPCIRHLCPFPPWSRQILPRQQTKKELVSKFEKIILSTAM